MRKKFKVIACKVLMREMYYLAWQTDSVVDIVWLEQQLHNTPDKLRSTVQAEIDKCEAEEQTYDAILLGYCLCSNGIVGLHTQKYPLVIVRGHDCVTMLLGSKERYKEIFDRHDGGIYWYSPGWIEHTLQPGKERYEFMYKIYVDKYGEDNAAYLMEMEQGWMTKYKAGIYVDWKALHFPQHEAFTRECADYLHWQCESHQGDEMLLLDYLEGRWDDERYLIVPPGMAVKATHDDSIIGTSPV